jgi:exopolyphosphatase/pppGpp-phosphohydrolase
LEIITPREEIELAALGAMSVFAKNTKVKFIFDIGGGSTEFGIFVYTNHAPKCVAFASLPYGILTLNPFATPDSKKTFSDHVRTVVQDMFSGCSVAHNINSVQAITTSGPLATIVTLNEGLTGYHGPNIHGLNMQYYTILHWIDKIEQMGSEEFSRAYGISNAMMSGLSILRGIVEATKIPIYISNTGVRDGILKSLFTERRLNQ